MGAGESRINAGLPTSQPLADQVLNHPVAEEKSEYTGKDKDPPEDCFWHPRYLTLNRDLVPAR